MQGAAACCTSSAGDADQTESAGPAMDGQNTQELDGIRPRAARQAVRRAGKPASSKGPTQIPPQGTGAPTAAMTSGKKTKQREEVRTGCRFGHLNRLTTRIRVKAAARI